MYETNVQQKMKREIYFDDVCEIAKEKSEIHNERSKVCYKAKTFPRVTLKLY